MTCSTKSLISFPLLAGIILLAGCSGSSANPTPPPVQTPVQAAQQQVSQPLPGQNPSPAAAADNATTIASQPQPLLPNRVEVIYFHVNQRCPTCLCFEQQVNSVIEANFGNAISSGKLTYKVLNAQQEQNADIARKYGVVGSQLFINKVVNGKDNIKDIQEIWNWNCRYNAPSFDGKVRSVIEESVKGLP